VTTAISSNTSSATAIPFLDVGAAYAELKEEIDAAVARVLSRGWFILGEEVAAFENEYAAYCGASHCVGVGNGLDALHLVLRAWGIGSGDEVIVPAQTFIATWLAVSYAGATPVPVEIDARTYNIDPRLVEAAITPRTRAVIAVHLFGQPADTEPLANICRERGIHLLEDAAQAHGAFYRGRRTGSIADAAAWSFYPGKNLGAMGDGGAITTNDAELAKRVQILANYGSSTKYQHEYRGFNSRLDEIQAAILRVKLRALDGWNRRRRTIAARYSRDLRIVRAPFVPDWTDPAWHLFVVDCDDRDAIQRRLGEAGIGALVHYPTTPFEQPAYRDLQVEPQRFPIAVRAARRLLSIPIGPHLTEEQVAAVVAALS
jgi:dTDP-4-amino-4,6-dideoxygalactose transaminase